MWFIFDKIEFTEFHGIHTKKFKIALYEVVNVKINTATENEFEVSTIYTIQKKFMTQGNKIRH